MTTGIPRKGKALDGPALGILARGVIDCPHCTLQREARLKAELELPGLRLAFARSIWGRRDSVPPALGRSWAAEFERVTGLNLGRFVAGLPSQAVGDPRRD